MTVLCFGLYNLDYRAGHSLSTTVSVFFMYIYTVLTDQLSSNSSAVTVLTAIHRNSYAFIL